jgi:hypothetical protein
MLVMLDPLIVVGKTAVAGFTRAQRALAVGLGEVWYNVESWAVKFSMPDSAP